MGKALVVSKVRQSAICLFGSLPSIHVPLERRMSQYGLWKAGETTVSPDTHVHDVGIMLNYMPKGNRLFFKEIHQHCLQTY